MQRFFLNGLIFLGSCVISLSSPLLIKPAPHGQQFPSINNQPKSIFQRKLLQPEAIHPTTKMIHGEQNPRAILILETRNNLVTVYSGETSLLYTVSTGEGAILAESLNESDLKDRFPELFDIVTGTAWAGKVHTP